MRFRDLKIVTAVVIAVALLVAFFVAVLRLNVYTGGHHHSLRHGTPVPVAAAATGDRCAERLWKK